MRLPFRRRALSSDGGPLWTVHFGSELLFDSDEVENVTRERQAAAEGGFELLKRLPESLREDPTVRSAFLGINTYVAAVAKGLRATALDRLDGGDLPGAATSAFKAAGVAGNDQNGFLEVAESWLLLAAIHARAGRYETARGQLDRARQMGEKSPLLNGSMREEAGQLQDVLDTRGDWDRRLDRLAQQIASEQPISDSGVRAIAR